MKKKIVCSLLAISVALSFNILSNASETETYGLQSRGKIEFTNNNEDPSDDVVFDAEDLYHIAEKCQ